MNLLTKVCPKSPQAGQVVQRFFFRSALGALAWFSNHAIHSKKKYANLTMTCLKRVRSKVSNAPSTISIPHPQASESAFKHTQYSQKARFLLFFENSKNYSIMAAASCGNCVTVSGTARRVPAEGLKVLLKSFLVKHTGTTVKKYVR